jgi:hypothetical protein
MNHTAYLKLFILICSLSFLAAIRQDPLAQAARARKQPVNFPKKSPDKTLLTMQGVVK